MKAQTQVSQPIANPRPTTRATPIPRSYPIILKEMIAALVAGLMLALAVVGLWFIVSPSIYLILVLIAIAFAIVGVSYLALMLVLYPPRSTAQSSPAQFGIAFWEDVGFRTTDGILIGAWFIAPQDSTGATIIFLHGMGANRSELLREAAVCVKQGYGALLLDLRNHGRSGAAMTTFGYREVEDVCAAVAYLRHRPEVNPARLGILGHSMGGATALCAAAQIPELRVVIAQSTFTSLVENIEHGVTAQLGMPPIPFVPLMAWLGEHVSGLRLNQVRPIDEIAQIAPRAVLLIHGKQDTHVSSDNSRRLYNAAYEPKQLYLVNGATHKSPITADPLEYEHIVTRFLAHYLRG